MNNRNNASLQADIQSAEIERSLDLVGDVWESDVELTVDEMCEQLEAIGDIIDNTGDFETFISATNLSGVERLN